VTSTVTIRLEISVVITSTLSALYVFFCSPHKEESDVLPLQEPRISCFACYVVGPLEGRACDNGKLLGQVLMTRKYYLALFQASTGVGCI